jgi:hypothetical protein
MVPESLLWIQFPSSMINDVGMVPYLTRNSLQTYNMSHSLVDPDPIVLFVRGEKEKHASDFILQPW